MKITKLKIANYKSIDSLELTNVSPFSVFAGANGAGKSNFFDALFFVRDFAASGIEQALRVRGGFENIRSVKRRGPNARKFEFGIEYELADDEKLEYFLVIGDLARTPQIEERIIRNGQTLLERDKGRPPILFNNEEEKILDQFSPTYSALLLYQNPPIPITELLGDLRLYRIDPNSAKEPDRPGSNPGILEINGFNLASVLHRLGKDKETRETILEWMEMIVPGLERISTEQQRLDSKTAILFEERGTRKKFPAHLISDGTVYALCMLVAVLDSRNTPGLTLIEEPERGLHPKAISELVGLMRECASPSNPIWLTTHSESIVRELKLSEFVFVEKKEGRTQMMPADSSALTDADIKPLGLDQAWLSNLLGGGLPW